MSLIFLIIGGLASLPLTAVGLPGSWLFLAGVSIWKTVDQTASVSWPAILVAFALAFIAEFLEWILTTRYTDKYGGSRRAGWSALAGGLVGAVIGVPIPVVGSIIGSFVGAFLGALIAEYSLAKGHLAAGRVAWGALVGRVVATGMKVAIGVVLVVIVVGSAAF